MLSNTNNMSKTNTINNKGGKKVVEQSETSESMKKDLEVLHNNLGINDIFKFMDLFFDRYGIIFAHLYNSYNKFLEEDIKTFLETGDHTFFERFTKDKIIKYKFKYDNISFRGPTLDNDVEPMFPTDARNRNLTYGGKLITKVTQIQEITDIATSEVKIRVIGKPEENVPIANLPVMLRSKICSLTSHKGYDKRECEYDLGGYFIVNGSEKVIISQDRMVENKPLVFIKKDSGMLVYTVQVNSKSYKPHGITQIINIRMKKDENLTIKVPIINEIPVFILFRALGIESDRDIINCVVRNEKDLEMITLLGISLDNSKNEKGEKIQTQQDAIDYLVNKLRVIRKYTETDKVVKTQQKRLHLLDLLNNSFLPHIDGDYKVKGYYLGYMVNKLLKCYLDRTVPDDRDSYVNKRIDLPGDLLFELFRQYYRKMLNECNKFFKTRSQNDDEPLVIINQIKPNIIEQGIKAALLTGAWPRRKGVAQMLQRYSFLQVIAFLRRIDAPGGDASTSKLTGPRHLHPSSTTLLCPVSTPEHAKVGLTKHLTLISSVTVIQVNQINIIKSFFLKKLINIRDIPSDKIQYMTQVFLNGEPLGLTNKPVPMEAELRKNKLNGTFDPTTSIVHDIEQKEIKVYCDGGRMFTPYMRVKDNSILLTKELINTTSLNKVHKSTKITSWDEFIVKHPNMVEYLDMEELFFQMVADTPQVVERERLKMFNSIAKVKHVKSNKTDNRYDDMTYVKYNHCVFHPSLLLAEIPTNIPFCNHNYGTRNIFQYAQGKQAMGIYVSNYRDRLDISYVLYHAQKPLITTRTAKYLFTDVLPAGENVIVAIMTYAGFNQEDSLVFSLSALDRGLFRSMSVKKHTSIIQKNQSTSMDDVFMKPDPVKVTGIRNASYDKLNDKGFVPEESRIVNNDIIICKLSPIQPIDGSNKVYKDGSEVYRSHAPAVIDKVYTNIYNNDGYEMIKLRTRSERKPNIGDKFCIPENVNMDVLTISGWKDIKTITKTDIIATLYNGNEIRYEPITDAYNFEYSGDIYKLRSQQVDLDVTMDHELYVKHVDKKAFELMPAKDVIGKHVQFKKNGHVNYKDVKEFKSIAGYSVNMNFWIKVFGIWLAGGYIEEIESIPSEVVTAYLVSLCDDNGNKSLPDWVWKLSQRQSQVLLEHMVPDQLESRYYVVSKNLANDVMRLAIHAGWYASIELINLETIYGKSDNNSEDNIFSVMISKSASEPEINHTKDNTEETYHFAGKVYCIEVPSHVFMVRQNNKNVWIGNCSRHGQKGTVGITLRQSDMPFSKHGVTPDICMNPNAVPSRMTIAQLIECLLGKVAAIQGIEADGTSFTDIDITTIKDALEKFDFKRDGTEYLINGMTGQKLKSEIFIGPTFYQRLKHLVLDKLHSRSRGPRTLLTRQAPEGRSRDGGLRLGEMERDAIIGHGLAKFLKEKMIDTSDAYSTYVCDKCGLFAQRLYRKGNQSHATSKDVYFCASCRNYTEISKIMIPYAFKLLVQELMSMNIAPRIRTKKLSL
jgi:DNA-directed RNA polymerase II subunit RPB2